MLPQRALRRAFPPEVTGVCVTLIGLGLVGTGARYWGGGVACADAASKRLRVVRGPDLAGNRTATYPHASPCWPDRCAAPAGALLGVCRYAPPSFEAARNATAGEVTECETFAAPPGVAPFWGDPARSVLLCAGARPARPHARLRLPGRRVRFTL
jgi:hypothetical protein